MAGDDAELDALIDTELDEEARGRLLARLEDDQVLRKRYERLRETGAPIAASLDALIDDAPLPGCATRCRRWSRPALAAGRSAELPFAISRRDLLSACWQRAQQLGSRLALHPQTIGVTGDRLSRNIWSSIRTRPSRSRTLTSRDFQARKLTVVAERVSAALTAEGNVSLPGPAFRVRGPPLLRGSAIGRNHLCRPARLAGLLRHR